ncbi:hypothetical protein NM688_g3114 [Phlebia brevispora]|uniref:Uncharacterized protein n=1 Tax=Phlebia brevispora TaxID=194682 RepID=A0ACC1T6W7_9APHY|nr:hypothetical protein NM688_g3114 [Phlebia brevispora]
MGNGSATAIAVGVTVSIVSVVLLGVAGFFYMRRRRMAGPTRLEEPEDRRSVVLERSHPASRVTPFGVGNDAPRFHHKPGEDMRFARRRDDGGWDFSAPLVVDPFARAPSRNEGSSSRCTSPTSSIGATSYYSNKEKATKDMTAHGYFDVDVYDVAPPAYTPRAT